MTTMVVKTVKGKQLHVRAELDTVSLRGALAKVEAAKLGEGYYFTPDEAAALEAVQRHPLTMKFDGPGCSA